MALPASYKERFPQFLQANMGHIHKTCQQMGIDRSTYYDWRATDPAFAEACDMAVLVLHDELENVLYDLVKEKDTQAVIFFCKKKLAYRGYGDGEDKSNWANKLAHREMKSANLQEADKALLDRYVEDRLKYIGTNKESETITVEAQQEA